MEALQEVKRCGGGEEKRRREGKQGEQKGKYKRRKAREIKEKEGKKQKHGF